MTKFDAIIVGTGQAGPSLAGRLTDAGMTVAIIERHHVGGTCVNTGCKPTKTLVASAYAAHLARHADDYGVTLGGGTVGIDMKKAKARKDAVVNSSRNGNERWLGSMKGCTLLRGHARLESARSVSINGELITADRIFLNVGGRASTPDLPGIKDIEYLTNSTILDLETLPKHLVVVGGSYIGLEFAQIYRRFGAEVTVVEKGPRLIGREDEDVSATIKEFLEAEGIRIRLNAECIRFAPHGKEIAVGVDCTTGAPEEMGSHVLLAMGRQPNTDDLGLEKAGVAVDARGYITVDDQLRTNIDGIWALGDCNGKGAFTHTAYNDFEIVAANLFDNDPRRVSDRISTYGLFVDPPLGRAGMTEAEARNSGRRVLVGKRLMKNVGRAVEKGETWGFMKVLVDADTKELLGAAILGTGGDEVVHGILDVMYAKAPYTVIQRAMHVHPTVSELIPTVLGDLKPLA
ncbi:Pyruvate/2-oxoglutarate dehydrogenase complex, dihydrolipoamide dehydrogenase (E3) component [Mesorhizobium albiziae]|uniref:Pyruvate/2-oxoglutarate dehydrogenase complex, dihydrolipoamide dehydrogenase (E3) component n=1 Tax=Neomesorhizobium albiziae TaxID=335020 RepID=A0A1I3Z9H8_9HYPH|nr:FAD-containing oxidoreductase [Mesorhizobium albiziae]GLS32064.1 mercuric reductase [Mesorhizobium albiziae]SFK40229.1 Pyruvate/2-oxoglutarate dehydrogenase complex, dihydrolipoamide dehydrogenase (E3) component [Mesorhizobium albiziae]